jgi:hypothetical protein
MSAVLVEEDPYTYRAVWAAVIKQSVREAMSFDADALEWFLGPPPDDLFLVCSLAGQNGEYVRSRIATWLLASATMISLGKVGAYDWRQRKFYWSHPQDGETALAKRFLSSEHGTAARRYAKQFNAGKAADIVQRALPALHA